VRLAIGIGNSADWEILQRFIGHPEIAPLRAANASTLVTFIKWVDIAIQDEEVELW
jgi:hypothetical protein